MAFQDKLVEEKDEFIESLALTTEKIREDMEKMRDIEGFPIGDSEDILELSDPPYYTAYPNPYIKDFIEMYGTPYDEETDDYDVEPFVGDVSEGKNESIYRAHTYHTKVPPKAIMRYIKHYTEKGDLVFDGFCGSGMTGIAAQKLNRKTIISDLAPSATFISYNYNILAKKNLLKIFNRWKNELEKYYVTNHDNKSKGIINYVVWSDVFICPFCNNELVFWDVSLTEDKNKSLKEFNCPNCNSKLTKRKLNHLFLDFFDRDLNKTVQIAKQKPVRIYYKYKNKAFHKEPDIEDLKMIEYFENMDLPYWIPLNEVPKGYNTEQARKSHGINYINQYYTKRAAFVLSYIFNEIDNITNRKEKFFLKWIFTSINPRLASKLAAYRVGKGKSNLTSGILYAPSFQSEVNVLVSFESKLKSLSKLNIENSKFLISTQSSTDLDNVKTNSIDYIFIDPPFGSNIMYSELNLIWESWLRIFTDNSSEAIINNKRGKDNQNYKDLLTECFKEFFRILKPNRWITVEFHNSKAEIWNLIRHSIENSGFVISQVAILDKKQGSFKQVTTPGSVKNDLVINAYKPSEAFTECFTKKSGLNLEKEFLEIHLNKLPVEPNIERTKQRLHSKLLTLYIQNGFEVRIDADEFYDMLNNYYVERDGYWFKHEQLLEYENRRNIKQKSNDFDFSQRVIGISDEKSAIIWLYHYLQTPKSYDEIFTEYTKNLLISLDKMPEIKTILEENFTTEGGKYRLPSELERKAKEEIRDSRLLKEFTDILKESENNRKIKEVRKEALLYGLMKLYKEKDVEKIKFLGKLLDRNIIDSDDDISAIIDWAMYN